MTNEETQKAISEQVEAALRRLMAQITSGKTPDLAKAYVAFWGSVPNVVKDATNPHLKNNYASLEATLAVVKPALAAQGLALLTIPGAVKDTSMQLTTMLVHSSGQVWQFTTDMPMTEKFDKKTGKVKAPGPQEMGSSISYARRYITQAISGQAAVDDDGEAAQGGADDGPEVADTSVLDAGMAGFLPLKDETGKDAAARFKDAFEAQVSLTGDQELVNKYLAKRKELRAIAAKK